MLISEANLQKCKGPQPCTELIESTAFQKRKQQAHSPEAKRWGPTFSKHTKKWYGVDIMRRKVLQIEMEEGRGSQGEGREERGRKER